jgi:hypothetical protein
MRNVTGAVLRQLGFGGQAAAAVMGLTENYVATLHNRALREGLPGIVRDSGRPRKLAEAAWARARRWRAAGASDTEIAARLGVDRSTVSRRLAGTGVQHRAPVRADLACGRRHPGVLVDFDVLVVPRALTLTARTAPAASTAATNGPYIVSLSSSAGRGTSAPSSKSATVLLPVPGGPATTHAGAGMLIASENTTPGDGTQRQDPSRCFHGLGLVIGWRCGRGRGCRRWRRCTCRGWCGC